MDIAKKELKEKTLPLVVVRNLPNGTVMEIPISNLIIL
jgi:hypothetical protein